MRSPLLLLLLVRLATSYVCKNVFFANVTVTATVKNDNRTESVPLRKCPMSTIILSENTVQIVAVDQDIAELPALSVSYLHYLERIDLRKNRIKYMRPNAFYELTSLKDIDLSHNDIEQVWNNCFNTLESLEHLNLANNLINRIDSAAFDAMRSLRSIDLGFNELTEWSSEWLAHSPKLFALTANVNRIKFLPGDAFAANADLSAIDFGRNEIASVHSRTFDGLNALYKLSLDNNKIRSLPWDAVAFRRLVFLYINNNRFAFLPKRFLDGLERIVYLNVHSNPFRCACHRALWRWIGERTSRIHVDALKTTCTRKSNPVCVAARENPRDCVERNEDEAEAIFWKSFRSASVYYPGDDDSDIEC